MQNTDIVNLVVRFIGIICVLVVLRGTVPLCRWLKEIAIKSEWKLSEIGKQIISNQVTNWRDSVMSDNAFKILVILILIGAVFLNYNKTETKIGRYSFSQDGGALLDTTNGTLYIHDETSGGVHFWKTLVEPAFIPVNK